METKRLFKVFNIGYVIGLIISLSAVTITGILYPTASISLMEYVKVFIIAYPVGLIIVFSINYMFKD
jgi:hypothetical protein